MSAVSFLNFVLLAGLFVSAILVMYLQARAVHVSRFDRLILATALLMVTLGNLIVYVAHSGAIFLLDEEGIEYSRLFVAFCRGLALSLLWGYIIHRARED